MILDFKKNYDILYMILQCWMMRNCANMIIVLISFEYLKLSMIIIFTIIYF